MVAMRGKVFGVLLLGGTLLFFGCAHTSTDVMELQSQLKEKTNEVKALESSVKEKDMALNDYKKKLDEQAMIAPEDQLPAEVPMEAPLLPSQAKPGECYARVFIPPTYKTVTEQRLKRGESERLETIPAKYEWGEAKVLIKGASERLETIPAEYDWVEENVLVKDASSRLEKVPAKYEWQEEQVLVRPAETVWKKGRGLIEKVDNTTGEIMCLIEVPAVYRTVKKKVMVSPPSTRKIEIPADYQIVKRKVMIKPPTTRTIEIPAEYKTVKVKKMISPPQEQRIPIPAEFQTITKTEQVTDGRMEWQRVLCQTNISNDLVAKIQKALKAAGNDPGSIDGLYGEETIAAVKTYQKNKNLAMGGLTYETIKSLGVDIAR